MAADKRSFGRIATSIATTLMGKHKPIYDPSTDCGDYVVAVGCHDLRTTGKKREKKKYYSHSTRPGRLQEISMERIMAKYGCAEVLRKAVSGMLPKNRLRDVRLARLKGICAEVLRDDYWQGTDKSGQHSRDPAIRTRIISSNLTMLRFVLLLRRGRRHRLWMRSRRSCRGRIRHSCRSVARGRGGVKTRVYITADYGTKAIHCSLQVELLELQPSPSP